jgi:putative transposase
MFAAEIRTKRASRMLAYSNWQWHLDEVFVKINGETHSSAESLQHRLAEAIAAGLYATAAAI